MSGGPIFVGGLSFSGKTPLRIALSAHPRIAMTRHTGLWERFHGRFGDLGKESRLEACLTALLAEPGVAALRPDRERLQREFRQGPPSYERLFALVHEQHARRLGKPRWGDQLGGVERQADRLLAAFPTARMLHLLRQPRVRLTDAAPQGAATPGKVARETLRSLHSAALARRNMRRHPGRYRVVRYEALAFRPQATLREVAAFLGEEYHPAMTDALAGHAPTGAVR